MIGLRSKMASIAVMFLFLTEASAQVVDYASLVNTQIGNKGKGARKEEAYLEAGYTFPGATYPFGMVQFTPTYFHPNKGFVVNQMSGAGCEHMGNFPTLPLEGVLKSSPNDMLGLNTQLDIQTSQAGFFKASAGNVECNLTVTPRTGMALYRFSGSTKVATILIGSGANGTKINDAFIKITGDASCEGYADGGEFCGSPVDYKVYFVAEFDTPFKSHGTWKGNELRKNADTVSGAASGAWFQFNVKRNKTIQYKFAISYVSIENARENLKAENAGWNFEDVRANTVAEWNKYLGRIEAKGSTPDHTTQFYTHFYHTLLHPNVCSDVNGDYVGGDHKVHKTIGEYYTGFSNWDTYRTQVQLIAMLFPERTSAIMNSIIDFAKRSGGGFPRWVLADTETGIMQGDPTSLLVANAYAFGAQQFDVEAALQTMRKGAEVPGTRSQKYETRQHLQQYLDKGYMHASMQLEYASADFAIGKFAKQAFNDDALYQNYLHRSQSWKNLFNPKTGWLQSRHDDGSWKKYDEDWREASHKNYFWMIPHNLKALVDLIGGKAAAEKRLDSFFVRLDGSYHQEWFASGNEPDFQVPWIYNWIGRPSKTQHLVKRIIREQYSNRPNGLPGNDDMGAMGAWYVFANIGLYPVVPAEPGFSINSPSFPEIVIHLPGGMLKIEGGSPEKDYVQSLSLNNKPYNKTWISLEALKNATLSYQLSRDSHDWVTNDTPPSYDVAKQDANLPSWALGPFIRPPGVNPVLLPDTTTTFIDPMTNRKVYWESNDVFNPAAAVKKGKIVVLYRAEDKTGKEIGTRTSRLGYAETTDGMQFTRRATPVLYPAKDNQQKFEWTGGCEDPRVARTEDGTYLMLYTQWNKKVPRLAVATSRDLITWKKHGPAFLKAFEGKYANMATKSASIITRLSGGEQVIAKINGRYMMYWGETAVFAATSDDLINWTPVEDAYGELRKLIQPREGYFDSQLTECGPPAVMTDKGIVLLYNGKNLAGDGGDKNYTSEAYCAGQVMFDLNDPLRPVKRLDKPFFVPTESFEKSGQYPAGTVFVEGLVFHQNKWFLYYGCADSRVAVAIYDPSN